MTTEILHDHQQKLEKQIEKQMGCMTGFLQLFDRHQILTGKRLYSPKRLPPSPPLDNSTSPAFPPGEVVQTQPSPAPDMRAPAEYPGRSPIPLPVFESKEGMRSMWKLREAPRLSLDSRAVMDGKGSLYPREIKTNATLLVRNEPTDDKTIEEEEDENEKQRRSPSVIARLMGLEALPGTPREPMKKKAELRRSASESRVSRDVRNVIDESTYRCASYSQSNSTTWEGSDGVRDDCGGRVTSSRAQDVMMMTTMMMTGEHCVRKESSEGALEGWKSRQQQQRKSYFDAHDVFPEPKSSGSLYGEIEKRLKMRGIDEPAKDLETLKQILEALQLKGLLHSKKPIKLAPQTPSIRNYVLDRRRRGCQELDQESPIVIMKPSRGNSPPPSNQRSKPPIHRNPNAALPPVKPRIAQRSMNRNSSNERSPSSVGRRGGGGSAISDQSTKSPKMGISRKPGSDQPTSGTSPRARRTRSTAEILPQKERMMTALTEDESSTTSTNSSQIEAEGLLRVEYYKEGRSLLERCDKLLNSIAEITTNTTVDMNLQQPSPVSVLDSNFYKDDSSPSPVMKRCINFKDYQSADFEEESWSMEISPIRLSLADELGINDCDFIYISEILQASSTGSEELDVFSLIEKQYYKHSSSKASRLHRKLVFDAVAEIVDREKQLPPWKAFSGINPCIAKPSFQEIWAEFRRIREDNNAEEDLLETVCGVLRKDMAKDKAAGWEDWPAEMSGAVLYIEKLIFKDVVAETIQDLAETAGKCNASLAPRRRKLVF
ncbi:hypothetical protein Sjap_006448 [Stephania japonica]|uniref:DUF4378 domain-containing protein n=1 Tax=Stephania japonica TaxID=461633 RepID=A0AAP0PLZ8_9MAGN